MKAIFAERLKNARKLAGFSQDDLVKALDGLVKKTSIAKYERAEMFPDEKVLVALSRALGVLPSYFTREFNVSIQKPEFRKKSKLGAKQIHSIQQKVMTSLEGYIELENLVGKDLMFQRPITSLIVHSHQDAEQAADQLLHEWGLGYNGIAQVFSMLEEHGVRMIEVSADKHFDGFSTYANGDIPVIVYNNFFPVDRIRLTVLHELGHLLLNFSDEVKQDDALVETLCFRFAAAILMPPELLIKELGYKRQQLSLPELIMLKERYGISVHALVRRARDLGIITQVQYTNFHFKYTNHRNEDDWGSYTMKERPVRFEQLLIRSVVEQQISINKAAELVNMKGVDFIEKYQLS